MRVLGYVIAALLAATCAANAATEDLSFLYAEVLQHPSDSAINLRYARMAEESGKLRWAYAAYERVVLNDPNNPEAQEGLRRVARKLQPGFTEFLLQTGASYESNPLYVPTNHTPEAQLFGTLAMKDERTWGDQRWRTTGLAAGIGHSRVDELNYGYVGATTGPVWDFIAGTTLHVAAGVGGAYFDHHPWYGEAIARATIEANVNGAPQSVAFRAAYRDYNNFFAAGQGWYWDVIGRFLVPGFIDDLNTLVVSPWVRRGDAPGATPISILQPGVEPANFIETGGRLELFRQIYDGVLAGPAVYLLERWYGSSGSVVVPRTTTIAVPVPTSFQRKDFIWSPGAIVFFPNLFAYQVGLKIEYQYIRDHSNDPAASFADNVVTASVVARF
jgi:hypothetical protein